MLRKRSGTSSCHLSWLAKPCKPTQLRPEEPEAGGAGGGVDCHQGKDVVTGVAKKESVGIDKIPMTTALTMEGEPASPHLTTDIAESVSLEEQDNPIQDAGELVADLMIRQGDDEQEYQVTSERVAEESSRGDNPPQGRHRWM